MECAAHWRGHYVTSEACVCRCQVWFPVASGRIWSALWNGAGYSSIKSRWAGAVMRNRSQLRNISDVPTDRPTDTARSMWRVAWPRLKNRHIQPSEHVMGIHDKGTLMMMMAMNKPYIYFLLILLPKAYPTAWTTVHIKATHLKRTLMMKVLVMNQINETIMIYSLYNHMQQSRWGRNWWWIATTMNKPVNCFILVATPQAYPIVWTIVPVMRIHHKRTLMVMELVTNVTIAYSNPTKTKRIKTRTWSGMNATLISILTEMDCRSVTLTHDAD